MARFLKPLVRSGGYYPSRRWTPLVYPGGYTTANGGEEPAPPPVEKTVIGNPIHILDALAKPVQALSIALEPVQDLHGYDNPWPAGGGKNLTDYTTPYVGQLGVNYQTLLFSLSLVGGTTYTFSCKQSATIPTSTRNCLMIRNPQSAIQYENTSENYNPTDLRHQMTITPAEDGTYDFLIWNHSPSVSVTYTEWQVEKSSSFTSYAPYSNICPISGWTGANVTRAGKNLLPNISGPRSEGSVFIGQANETTYPTHLKAGVTYAISFNTNVGSGFAYMKENGGSNLYFGISGGTYTPEKDMDVQMWVYDSELTSVSDFQLELGSTATAYAPYQGETYSIPLGTTVYGCVVDAVRGKGLVTKAYADAGSLPWGLSGTNVSGQHRFACTVPTVIAPSGSTVPDIICSQYKAVSANDTYSQRIGISNNLNLGQIIIFDPAYKTSSAADFKTAMSGVQIVYPLAEPFEITLTPQQIELLQGENNLWSDGEMTLVYLADGNASDVEALNILLGGRYVNNHTEGEPTDREALDIVLGGKK